MRRLLVALPLLLAACGPPQPAETPAAPTESAPPAPAPTAAPSPAPTPAVEPSAAAPPAPEPAAPKAAPAPAPVTKSVPAITPAATGDVANGQRLYLRCRACHTLAAGGVDGIGPNLHGVFGRKAGGKAGYTYSPALAAAGFTWTAARMDSWIADPKALVPGNKMVFVGLKDAKERGDLIAYLQAETR